jgi:DNA-binding transcriptional regulator LsrR (DeoR family)
MPAPTTLTSAEIVAVAEKLGVSRGSLQAQLSMAESEGELDVEPTLNALRALEAILGLAEGTS